jgi:hypothetical protein
VLQKFSLAVMIRPSGVNSMTAWERAIASSFPASSIARSLAYVISEAILTTLKGRPFFITGL